MKQKKFKCGYCPKIICHKLQGDTLPFPITEMIYMYIYIYNMLLFKGLKFII